MAISAQTESDSYILMYDSIEPITGKLEVVRNVAGLTRSLFSRSGIVFRKDKAAGNPSAMSFYGLAGVSAMAAVSLAYTVGISQAGTPSFRARVYSVASNNAAKKAFFFSRKRLPACLQARPYR